MPKENSEWCEMGWAASQSCRCMVQKITNRENQTRPCDEPLTASSQSLNYTAPHQRPHTFVDARDVMTIWRRGGQL